MSSTAWFLLEFSILLGLAAVLFGWLGWHWRGTDKSGSLAKLEAQLHEEIKAKRYAMDERDAARAETSKASVHVSDAARLIEESEAIENQNIRLREDLTSARREATLQSDAAAKAHESRAALEAETTRLQHEISLLKATQHDPAVDSALNAAQNEIAQLQQQIAANTATAAQQLKAAEAEIQQLKAAETEIQQLKATQHDPAVDSALKAAQNEIAQLQQQVAANTATAAQIAQLQQQIAANTAAAAQQLKAAESEIQKLKATQHDPAVDSALKAAENEIAQLQQQITTDSQAAAQHLLALQNTHQQLQLEVESLRADRQASKVSDLTTPPPPSATPEAITVKPAPVPKPATIPKPKTIRVTGPKPKAPHPATLTAAEKLTQLQHDLAPQLTLLAALTQERDDWTRRIDTLQAKTPPDLAGLGLARRSLASSEERFNAATASIQALQDQQHALQRALEQSTALAGVPDDDLTKIKGIKSVIRDQLHAFGIRTYRQIAAWDAEDLHAYSELLAFKNRASRDHWQDQARQLHEASNDQSAE